MYQNNVRRTGVYISPNQNISPPALLPKSQIINRGNKDVEGQLTIIIQKSVYEINESPTIITAIDEKITVSKDKPFALDKIFNKQNISINEFPNGGYYVVATFLTSNNSTFQSSYQFTIV